VQIVIAGTMAFAKCLYSVMVVVGINVCAELTDQELLGEV